jgi:hypothetical protein
MITKLTLACTLFVALFVNAHTAQSADLGIGLIPDDAAFLASTLRGREQYDRIVASNAFASLKELKSVAKALDELAKQQTQPGNPMAIAMMMMQMPDNQEALALLKDMVATDTFVFGTSSWVTVSKLFKKLQSAQQAANIATITKGTDLDLDTDTTLNRLIAETLAANTDQIVIPDLAWGFHTTQTDAAKKQLDRIEGFATSMAQSQPMLADAVARQKIGAGDFITVTIKPDPNLIKMAMSNVVKDDMEEKLEKILKRVGELEIVVALGIVKEHVVLSIGGGTEHLQAMGSTGGSLLDTRPFEVVRDATEKSLTSIWYRSQKLAKAWETSPEDIEQAKKFAAAVAKANDLTPEATAEAEELVGELLEGYASQMPEAGPWLAYSYLTDTGYAGEEWNWAKNIPWNGSMPLSLDHFGGDPLALIALRTKTDAEQFEAFVSWANSLRKFVSNAIASTGDDDVQEGFKTFDEKIVPLGEELTNTVREKFLPSLKNGQFGLVLDGKATTTKLQADLPSSSEPLPLIEPAIVLSLDDDKLFREGLSDIFALSDKVLSVIREIDEDDNIPSEYRIPDPEEKDAEGGNLWTFALPESGLDEQIQLSIGVGKNAAVFSFTPTQAERILTSSPLQLEGDFSQNLAAAAILDWVAFANLLEPWATYVIRCGGMQQEKGRLDPDSTIGPDSETEEVTDALEQLATIFDVVRCLKSATAKTSIEEDATVTRWQNRIEDLPAK